MNSIIMVQLPNGRADTAISLYYVYLTFIYIIALESMKLFQESESIAKIRLRCSAICSKSLLKNYL